MPASGPLPEEILRLCRGFPFARARASEQIQRTGLRSKPLVPHSSQREHRRDRPHLPGDHAARPPPKHLLLSQFSLEFSFQCFFFFFSFFLPHLEPW